MRVNDRVTTPKGNGKITSLIPSKLSKEITWAYILLDNGRLECYDTVKIKLQEGSDHANPTDTH